MNKILNSLLLSLTLFSCGAQTSKFNFSYDNFENEVIEYQPDQNDLSEKSFNHGLMILGEIKKDVKSNPKNFNCADYFNVLSSFISLKENSKNIKIAFEKLKNSDGSCEYFLSKRTFNSEKYDIIRGDIEKQIIICSNSNKVDSTPIDLREYAADGGFDYELVFLIDKTIHLDEKYRQNDSIDWSKQRLIDLENQRIIDSLYHSHQKYVGASLVGEKYNQVMWLVVQHSNPKMMEKYLPIIQKAVQENELSVTPFKMLIDRYYGLKYGYQVFGSQSGFGFEMADEKKRKEIQLKHGIE